MYLRITRGHFDPARNDEMRPIISDVIAAIRQLPGCQDVQAGVDGASGKTISVITFDTLEHAQFQRPSLGAAFTALQAHGWQAEPPDFYELWM